MLTPQTARWWMLEVELPGNQPVKAGILLEDAAQDRVRVRTRRDWDLIAPEEAEVLAAMEGDLTAKASELGAGRLLQTLEDTLSNTVRVSGPREVLMENVDRAVARLYREQIQSTVQEFVTHLPRYSLKVAAGNFIENQEAAREGWEEAPGDLKLRADMFVAGIQGHSMEPKIPDGSLCVFRLGATGSRQGRLVLVEQCGGGTNDRYTVKRYRSHKRQAPDGTWLHQRITLEPLNPEFESWDLDPQEDRYRVIGEFVRVLD